MSPAEDRERLIEALRQKPDQTKHSANEWRDIIMRELNSDPLEACSNRVLIGSSGFGSIPTLNSFEVVIGTLYAIRSGIVFYVPSQRIIDLYCGECGFLVPSASFHPDMQSFAVQTIPKRRYAECFGLGFFSVPVKNEIVCIAGFGVPEKSDPTTIASVAVISPHRWENELKPWLDHWLPS